MVNVNDAIDAAFVDHVKTLFAGFVRHLSQGAADVARSEFRKGLAVANQARSEMEAIAGENA